MLKRFTVTNFKNFKNTTTFALDQPANYEFNSEIVKNNCITKGIIFGINGSGKSNLALALFDVVLHLTDKEKLFDKYQFYLNMDSDQPTADFEYVFEFDKTEVIYRYKKALPGFLVQESLTIAGKEVVFYDYVLQEGFAKLEGAETMQLKSMLTQGVDTLSRVKYIKSNAILKDNEVNRAFISFVKFVDNMLMFYSLDQNRYQGFYLGGDTYTQGIIRENKIKEFEDFLKEHGVDYRLIVSLLNGQQELFCQFKNGIAPFMSVASTGTRSLALFYYWYIKMSTASFVYVDEYDAFYHFELAQTLVELVKELDSTQVFFSTHNTDLLSNDLLRPDAFFQIKDNQIHTFDKIAQKELRRAHNIQKMYKAGTFDE